MTPRNDAIQAVIKALPRYAGAIEEAFTHSGEFRSICEDFYACSRALGHWEKSTSTEAPAQAVEYRELLQELKQEVVTWLEARKDRLDATRNGSPDAES